MILKKTTALKNLGVITGCLVGLSVNLCAVELHSQERHETCPEHFPVTSYSTSYQEMLKERPVSLPVVQPVTKVLVPGPIAVIEQPKAVIEQPKVIKMDDDKDGVYNEKDKCSNTPKGYKVDIDGCPQSVSLHINFKTGSDILPKSADKDIDTLVNFMQENPAAIIEIIGHTDNVGEALKNLKLSKNRSHSLAVRIIENGISDARISTDGKGLTQPIASNKTRTGKAKNRRIDVKIK